MDASERRRARPRAHRDASFGDRRNATRATEATGRAHFRLADDGQSIDYRLEVDDITNVVQAHIHVGSRTINGPVVVFRYGPVPAGGGPVEGEIARGTITAANLIGPLAGQPLSRLLQVIARDSAYVNVHTNAGIAGAPPAAGNFPGGEVRGHLDDAKR